MQLQSAKSKTQLDECIVFLNQYRIWKWIFLVPLEPRIHQRMHNALFVMLSLMYFKLTNSAGLIEINNLLFVRFCLFFVPVLLDARSVPELGCHLVRRFLMESGDVVCCVP